MLDNMNILIDYSYTCLFPKMIHSKTDPPQEYPIPCIDDQSSNQQPNSTYSASHHNTMS